jgi:hypothetical protein
MTRERVEGERTIPAFKVLVEILESGIIRGSGNVGFVKGNRPAVCLSEIPLSALRDFTSPPVEMSKTRYRPHGILFAKQAIFKAGGRPVIYLPDDEGDWIPSDQKWRHVRFEAGSVDFTHEREWRVPDSLDINRFAAFYVIVWSPTQARWLRDNLQTPLKDRIIGILPMGHLMTMM